MVLTKVTGIVHCKVYLIIVRTNHIALQISMSITAISYLKRHKVIWRQVICIVVTNCRIKVITTSRTIAHLV